MMNTKRKYHQMNFKK